MGLRGEKSMREERTAAGEGLEGVLTLAAAMKE